MVVIEPGAIRTEWGGIAHQSLLERSGDSAYAPYARRQHAALLEAVAAVGELPARRPRWWRTPSPGPPPRGDRVSATPTGGGAKIFLLLAKLLPDRTLDALMWRMSQAGRIR